MRLPVMNSVPTNRCYRPKVWVIEPVRTSPGTACCVVAAVDVVNERVVPQLRGKLVPLEEAGCKPVADPLGVVALAGCDR